MLVPALTAENCATARIPEPLGPSGSAPKSDAGEAHAALRSAAAACS